MRGLEKYVIGVGVVLLVVGIIYTFMGPIGLHHGWSEHDYLAWGLIGAGSAIIAVGGSSRAARTFTTRRRGDGG